MAILGSHLTHIPRHDAAQQAVSAPAAGRNRQARAAVTLANLSFFTLLIGAGLLILFFAFRTYNIGGMAFERAIAIANVANKTLIDATKGESTSLKSLELQGDTYRLVFQITPGSGTTTILTDSLGTNVKSATRSAFS
jgi:hypothetical protein